MNKSDEFKNEFEAIRKALAKTKKPINYDLEQLFNQLLYELRRSETYINNPLINSIIELMDKNEKLSDDVSDLRQDIDNLVDDVRFNSQRLDGL